jgi:hypothetical protein
MNDSFSFISDDILRGMIERDKKELDESLSSGLYKSAIILAGSLIEAILVDYFLAFTTPRATSQEILQASLSQLIDWATEESLISQRTHEISTAIRNYRNLIHPGKEYRLSERVDIHSATVAKHLAEIFIKEVGENYSNKLGYKAEAAIAKVKLDPSSVSLFKHMVEQMSVIERIKLFRSIPQICADEDLLPQTIENFIRLHALLSENVPQDAIREETQKIKQYLNHKGREETLFYLRFFMRHLELLEQNDRIAVIEYLLDLLATGTKDTLKRLLPIELYMLGKSIDQDGQQQLLSSAIMRRFYNSSTVRDDAIFLALLENLFIGLPYEYTQSTKKKFGETDSQRAGAWVEAIEQFIPF